MEAPSWARWLDPGALVGVRDREVVAALQRAVGVGPVVTEVPGAQDVIDLHLAFGDRHLVGALLPTDAGRVVMLVPAGEHGLA